MASGRMEIGFSGGQVVAVRMSDDKVQDLRKKLDKADGWTDIETEDGSIALDLRQVVFLRGAPGEHRIGFTG
jgi:phosphosulfolactate synthase (CoM biosynthesis protein A)